MTRDKKKQFGWALVTFGAIVVAACFFQDNSSSDINIASKKSTVFSKEELESKKITIAISLVGTLVAIAGVRTLLRAEKGR